MLQTWRLFNPTWDRRGFVGCALSGLALALASKVLVEYKRLGILGFGGFWCLLRGFLVFRDFGALGFLVFRTLGLGFLGFGDDWLWGFRGLGILGFGSFWGKGILGFRVSCFWV